MNLQSNGFAVDLLVEPGGCTRRWPPATPPSVRVLVGPGHPALAFPDADRTSPRPWVKASRGAGLHLAGGHADHSWASRLRKLAGPALLVLDDFGMPRL